MSTITRRDIIAEMLENEGRYSDDPIPATVWSYWSTLAECRQWAVFYTWTHDMHTAPHVVDPVLLMEDGEITDAGRRWLDDEEQDGGGREEGGRSCSSRG